MYGTNDSIHYYCPLWSLDPRWHVPHMYGPASVSVGRFGVGPQNSCVFDAPGRRKALDSVGRYRYLRRGCMQFRLDPGSGTMMNPKDRDAFYIWHAPLVCNAYAHACRKPPMEVEVLCRQRQSYCLGHTWAHSPPPPASGWAFQLLQWLACQRFGAANQTAFDGVPTQLLQRGPLRFAFTAYTSCPPPHAGSG